MFHPVYWGYPANIFHKRKTGCQTASNLCWRCLGCWQVKHFDIKFCKWPLCCLGWAGFSDTNILSTVHILAKAQFPSNAEMCRHCEQNFFDFLHDKDCLHNNLSAVFTCMYHTCCIHSGALLIYTPVRQLSHWTVQYRNLNAVHTCSKHPLKNDKRGSTVHSHYTVNVLILNVDGLSTQWTQRCCQLFFLVQWL